MDDQLYSASQHEETESTNRFTYSTAQFQNNFMPPPPSEEAIYYMNMAMELKKQNDYKDQLLLQKDAEIKELTDKLNETTHKADVEKAQYEGKYRDMKRKYYSEKDKYDIVRITAESDRRQSQVREDQLNKLISQNIDL